MNIPGVSKSKSKSYCDWQSVGQSVLVSYPIWGIWPGICLLGLIFPGVPSSRTLLYRLGTDHALKTQPLLLRILCRKMLLLGRYLAIDCWPRIFLRRNVFTGHCLAILCENPSQYYPTINVEVFQIATFIITFRLKCVLISHLSRKLSHSIFNIKWYM
jgi:hypothetical protein